MSSETSSGSGDEADSSPEYDPASSSSSESSRQITTKVTPRKRVKQVKRNRGKDAMSSPSGANRSSSNAEEARARSVESFVSHRLVVDPPPTPAVIKDEIAIIKGHSGTDMSSFGQATTLSLSALEELARSIPWPAGIELCLPERGGTSLARYENCLVIFVASVEAGFRLPLPDFYRDFLRLINLNPTQLYPNAWRYLSGYTMRCYRTGLSPYARHILKIFTLKSDKGFCNLSSPTVNLISKPSNVGNWKDRWFLARCSSHAVFNSPLYPGIFLRPDKGDQKEIDACKKQFRNEGHAPDYRRVITQQNLEKAGLSLPCSVRRAESGMKTDFLVKRAKKITSGSKATSKVVGNQTASEEGPPVTTDAQVMSHTKTSVQVPPVDVQARVVERDVPSETCRVEKRPRCESRSDPAPSPSIGMFSFPAPVPSLEDMRRLAPSNDICVREKVWLTSLSPEVLQLEGMKYMEMARLSMWTSLLDAKCKGIREENDARTKVVALNSQNQQLIEELATAKAKAISLEGEKETLVDDNARLAEQKAKAEEGIARFAEQKAVLDEVNARLVNENALLKANVETCQRAMADKDRETAELQKQFEASKIESENWRVRAGRAVSDYLTSEEFQMKVADEVGPHWEQGMRIGVRQAVTRFGEIDPEIAYFTPDVCGEPSIDPGEGGNQAMEDEENVSTNTVTREQV